MSFLLELLFEFVFQFVIELLVEMGAHTLKRDAEPMHPALSVLAYVVLGGLLGAASHLAWP